MWKRILLLLSLIMPGLIYAIEVAIPTVQQTIGKAVDVPIQVTDLTGQNILQYQFSLMYDPNLITAVRASRTGTLTAGWDAPAITITEGAVQIQAQGTTALTGAGNLINIEFRVNAAAKVGSSSPLVFTSFRFNDGVPGVTTSNGTLLVIPDLTPPVIVVSPSLETLSTSEATIIWETDEPANSVVQYGLDQTYPLTTTDHTLVRNHRVKLTNLAPARTYYYRVRSTDGSGNGPTTSAGYSFVTTNILLSLPVIGADPGREIAIPVSITDITGLGVTAVSAGVTYDPNCLQFQRLAVENTLTFDWRLPNYKLIPGTIEFQAQGATPLKGGGVVLNLIFQVVTPARIGKTTSLNLNNATLNAGAIQVGTKNGQFEVRDTQAPEIIRWPAVVKTSVSSAMFQWETDEAATSVIEFGPRPQQYVHRKASNLRTFQHAMLLHGLKANTRYFYRVSAVDSSLNGPTWSQETSFITGSTEEIVLKIDSVVTDRGSRITVPLRLSNAPTTDITRWYGVIQFNSQLLTITGVSHQHTICKNWYPPQYSVSGDFLIIQISGGSYLKESGVFLNLECQAASQTGGEPGTGLEFVESAFNDGYPLAATENGYVEITGGRDTTPPKRLSGPLVDLITPTSATIFWITDEPSTSQIQYGVNSAYGKSVHLSPLVREHQITLENLTPNTSYHFIALSADQYQNDPLITSDGIFQTAADKAVIVTIPDRNLPAGATFQLPIRISQLNGLEVKRVNFKLHYNQQILLAGKASLENTVAASWSAPTYSHEAGAIQVQLEGTTALADTGVLVRIQFQALPAASIADFSLLNFSIFTVNQGATPVAFGHGRFYIQDAQPPKILSGPVIEQITTNSAIVRWETDEPASSYLEFGVTAATGMQLRSDLLTRSHLIKITDLLPNTRYALRVSGLDSPGNGPTVSPEKSFQTQARTPFILSLPDFGYEVGHDFYLPINMFGATLSNPIYAADFTLKYDPRVLQYHFATGVGALCRDWNIQAEKTSDSTVAVHLRGNWNISKAGILVKLSMTPYNPRGYGKKTELALLDARINDVRSDVQTLNGYFTLTPAPEPEFLIGPAVNQLHKNSARIFWITDKLTNGKVEYGLTDAYGMTLIDQKVLTAHTIDIFGLQPGTTYHYRVTAEVPANAKTTVSSDLVFKTSTGDEVAVFIPDTSLALGHTFAIPVMIQNVTNKNLQQFNFSVAFDPTVLAPGNISREQSLTQNWTISNLEITPARISGRAAGTQPLTGGGRLFEIQGMVNPQAVQNTTTIAAITDFNFNFELIQGSTKNAALTLVDQGLPQFIMTPRLKRAYSNSAVIEWSTNELTTAKVDFGPDSLFEKSLAITASRQQQTITLNGLEAGRGYILRVAITDAQGNGPVASRPIYFTTAPQPVYLRMPEVALPAGEIHSIPVRISGLNGAALRNYEFTLNFDGSKLIAVRVAHEHSLTESWGQSNCQISTHEISISQRGESAITTDGVLAWINFLVHPKANAGERTALRFSKMNFNENGIEMAADTATLTVTKKSAAAAINVVLPDTSIQLGNWCLLPIRVTTVTNRGITRGEFDFSFNSNLLSCGGAVQVSNMLNQGVNLQSQVSKNRVQVTFESATPISGQGTMLRLFFRVRPEAEVDQSSAIHGERFVFNDGEPPVVVQDGRIALIQWRDIISGYVVERDSLNGIQGVTVQLTGENNPVSRTATTDKIGRFFFAGLDTAQAKTYTLTLSKNGFDSSAPVSGVRVAQPVRRLVLYRRDGTIQGRVTTPNGFPIPDAAIVAEDNLGAGAGHAAATRSDRTGQFILKDLNRIAPFQLKIQKPGYKTLILQQLYTDTTLWCVPSPYFSTVLGQVTNEKQQPLVDVRVVLTDTLLKSDYDSLQTDSNGNYQFPKIVPGIYFLTLKKPGFLAASPHYLIEVKPAQTYHTNLVMQTAVLAHFEIQGSRFVPNTTTRYRYRFQARTATGEKMELTIAPVWQLSPGLAGSLKSGILAANPVYFSDAVLVLTDTTSGVRDSLKLVIYAPVTPATDREFTDARGFHLKISPGAVLADTMIYVQTVALPPATSPAYGWRALGQAFDLQPPALTFQNPAELNFPVPAGQKSTEVRLACWEEAARQWALLPNVMPNAQGDFETTILKTGRYALVNAAEPLALNNLRLVPNPFSTEIDTDGDGEPGLAVHFIASSEVTNKPLLTIRIYNLLGELVREIYFQAPVEKATPTTVRWDGLTDAHLRALNGRYLLHLIIEDSTGKKEYLMSIILVK